MAQVLLSGLRFKTANSTGIHETGGAALTKPPSPEPLYRGCNCGDSESV